MIRSAKDTLGISTANPTAYEAVLACLAEVEAEQAENEDKAAQATDLFVKDQHMDYAIGAKFAALRIRGRFRELLAHGGPSRQGPKYRAEMLPPSLSGGV